MPQSWNMIQKKGLEGMLLLEEDKVPGGDFTVR